MVPSVFRPNTEAGVLPPPVGEADVCDVLFFCIRSHALECMERCAFKKEDKIKELC